MLSKKRFFNCRRKKKVLFRRRRCNYNGEKVIKRLIGEKYIDIGNGKTLLFLHGYKSCKESFVRQINFFSRFCRVVAVDLTGFGKAEKLPYPYSLEDYALEVKRILDFLGIEKVDIVAHSFGARVTVKLISLGESRIDRIIFTGAAGLKPRRRLSYLLKRASFLLLKNFIKKEKLIKFYSVDYRKLTLVEKESFKLIVNEHLDGEYKKINSKTLIVFGKKDKSTPPYMARKIKRYVKNSQLEFIKCTGHFCFVDEYDKFNSLVFSFLFG